MQFQVSGIARIELPILVTLSSTLRQCTAELYVQCTLSCRRSQSFRTMQSIRTIGLAVSCNGKVCKNLRLSLFCQIRYMESTICLLLEFPHGRPLQRADTSPLRIFSQGDDSSALYTYSLDDAAKSAKRMTVRVATEFVDRFLSSFADYEPLGHWCHWAIGVKLLVPAIEGYVARSDVFERRFEGCSLLQQAKTFVEPLQQVKPGPETNEIDLLMPHALGLLFFVSTMRRC